MPGQFYLRLRVCLFSRVGSLHLFFPLYFCREYSCGPVSDSDIMEPLPSLLLLLLLLILFVLRRNFMSIISLVCSPACSLEAVRVRVTHARKIGGASTSSRL